ncbi:MAG: hypothetical protein RLY78_1770 [Pseudomonadota bacterium]
MRPDSDLDPTAEAPPLTTYADPAVRRHGPSARADDGAAEEAATAMPWIVVVGASAGGLEALQRYFEAITPPTQAAFVIIQHLAPDHRSMMPELLSRHCCLPVHQAEAGEGLLADRVYLMPPGVLMTLEREQLAFAPRPRHGVSLPIDQFLSTLDAALAPRTLAVILSGSGSDGSQGARVLRDSGGYVMAQQPDTARFDSMPRNAIAATRIDAVLPPTELADRTLRITRGECGRLGDGGLIDAPSTRPALQRLFDTLRGHCGIDFSHYKLPTMMRRIERRMAALALASMSDYADRVQGSIEECEALRQELLIPVTSFFRDATAWEALSVALRQLLRDRADNAPLRIWSAGCATGEEAYTLAMLALEACQAEQRWPGIKVFASDVDTRSLAQAGSGSYPAGAGDGLSAPRLAQHFVRQDERITVRPELRQMVLFARHNLMEDAPFTRMDLVVCRNTLIYFQADAQEHVMRRLQYALNPGGLLMLGSSESLGALQPDFQVVDGLHKLYRLVRPVLITQTLRDFGPRSTPAGPRGQPPRTRGGAGERGPRTGSGATAVDLAQQALMQAYVPVSLLITAQRQLLHAWGPAERFLRVSGGQPNLDAIRLLPPRLGAVVGNAVQRALRERQPCTAPPLWMELDGRELRVRVVARPLPASEEGQGCVLASIETLPDDDGPRAHERPLDSAELDRLAGLERELSDTRLTLQGSIEELEAANEELQAANEELMSSNEELQSTNEELQSVNEELYTVNAEYNAKLDLVNALNADLEGMSQATGIATLFVDPALALVRFTPEAQPLFRLRREDVGRHIGDFNCQIDYPELVGDLTRALAGESLIEREIAGLQGQRHLARVVGYAEGGARRRAVLSLVDVSRLHDARRLQRLIDSLPQHIAVLDRLGTITQVNRAWRAFAQANAACDAEGRPLEAHTEIGVNYLGVVARSTTPDAGQVLLQLQQLLAGQRDRIELIYPCDAPDEPRWFALQALPLGGAAHGEGSGAVVSHLDITRWYRPPPASAAALDADSGPDRP